MVVRLCSMVVRIPAFQPGGPNLIPDGAIDFNFHPEVGCMTFMFCPGGGPSILLSTDSGSLSLANLYSVLVHRLWLLLQAAQAFGLLSP